MSLRVFDRNGVPVGLYLDGRTVFAVYVESIAAVAQFEANTGQIYPSGTHVYWSLPNCQGQGFLPAGFARVLAVLTGASPQRYFVGHVAAPALQPYQSDLMTTNPDGCSNAAGVTTDPVVPATEIEVGDLGLSQPLPPVLYVAP
jgi:hypothetical protein